MQLSDAKPRRSGRSIGLVAAALAIALIGDRALADGDVTGTATTTVYREAGGPLEMTVITPSVNVSGTVRDRVVVSAGWEADVVSGASVAVVDAPGADLDAITSATRLEDFRNTGRAALGFLGDVTRLDVGYSYGRENDYESHAFSLAGRAELFDRNTIFELSYARGFDRVCNLAQPGAQEAVDRQRMPSSDGCFEGVADRELLDLSIQTFQGAWTQAWTPTIVSQLTLTTQVLNGYQANPYRAVWLGRAAAQEHHPENRTRYAAGLGFRIWLQPLRGALQPFVRIYRDTWDIASITGEMAYEQTISGGLRLRLRGRYYVQRGAVFFSDNYAFEPAGEYFTGDRELSPMSSWLGGGQVIWSVPAGDDGRVGFLRGLNIIGKADYLRFRFDEFRYGRAPVPNNTAIVVTAHVEALF